jgi:hypothetical protein
MTLDESRKRRESVLGAGKRPERHPFLAHLGSKVASVLLPIGTSVLGREKKNGYMLALLLMPSTLPFMSAYF